MSSKIRYNEKQKGHHLNYVSGARSEQNYLMHRLLLHSIQRISLYTLTGIQPVQLQIIWSGQKQSQRTKETDG